MKQPDTVGTVKDLAMHRIETARSDIHAAQILLGAAEYRSSNNRAYYGIYHAISAIHALDGKHNVILVIGSVVVSGKRGEQ